MNGAKQKTWLFIALFSLLILANLYLFVQVSPLVTKVFAFLKTVLFPFFIAMVISYILNPVVTVLTSRMVPRTIAVLLIYATFVVSSLVLFMNAVPVLSLQISEIAEHLPEWNRQLQGWSHKVMDGTSVLPLSVQRGFDESFDNVEQYISENVEQMLTRLSTTISQLFQWFLVPFVAFYMLKDFKVIERAIPQILPKGSRKRWMHMFRDIDEALGNYVRGQFLVCVAVGTLAYIGYVFIGLPYAFLLAAVVAIMNVIPYLGPIIGAAPAVLVGLSVSWKTAFLAFVVNSVVQILEGNVISPQIVGRTLKIHPLLIILALLVGGQLGGIIGLILAVPVFAALKVVLEHFIRYYVHP